MNWLNNLEELPMIYLLLAGIAIALGGAIVYGVLVLYFLGRPRKGGNRDE